MTILILERLGIGLGIVSFFSVLAAMLLVTSTYFTMPNYEKEYVPTWFKVVSWATLALSVLGLAYLLGMMVTI